ncbi:hypothetical protein Nepgr_014548 [Nepenthes gracilis]|uniref:Uncharacterized protein n=1 Tax=Nepenthes gracilis TaxID=150966 RepID=A0AAD3SLB2_NEPGR|nr:hypothetical protein Nepgr_014548 [Nepenthes gracilis]
MVSSGAFFILGMPLIIFADASWKRQPKTADRRLNHKLRAAAPPEGPRLSNQAASHSAALAMLHTKLGAPGTMSLADFCLRIILGRNIMKAEVQDNN